MDYGGGKKQFIILGNKNAITYKEVFPLIKSNQLWLGTTSPKEFDTPDGKSTKKVSGLTRWFTNLDHGIRHEKMMLDTRANNLRFNKSLRKKLIKYGDLGHYPKYDNYDAIEIPIVQCIPSDYDGEMGVPITFIDKYNPEQFEIIGTSSNLAKPMIINNHKHSGRFYINGQRLYDRLVIKHKNN